MKRLQLIIFLFASFNLVAQDETIFGDVNRIGGFGGPIFEFSNFGSNSNSNTAVGGGGALILDDFYVGGYGIGGIDFSQNNFSNVTLDIQKLEFGHGGMWFGYTPLQEKAIHPYASAKIGWGEVRYEYDIDPDPDNIDKEEFEDRIFAITPEVGVEFNVFHFFRIAATATYRWVDGVDTTNGFQDKDFSKFGATLTLRFGGFGNYWWDD